MDLTHSFTVPTSVDDAWALFMDLEKVGSCFPGATVTEVRDDGFSGTVKVKLGPIALVYSGSGSFVARDDATHRAVIEARGKDKRGNGTAGANVTISLSPDGAGTRADVVTDLAVTGKPAQFGRGVMQDVSDKLLQSFVACVEKQLGGEQPSPTTAPATAAAAPASDSPVETAPEAGFVETASDALAADTASTTTSTTVSAPAKADTTGVPSASRGGPHPRRVPTDDDALDLGSAVLPVLVRRYAGFAAAAAIGVFFGWVLGRRH